MKPVDQTEFGDKTGNCVAACIASVFELDITAVPNFWHSTQDPHEFWEMLNDWTETVLGYKAIPVAFNEGQLYCIDNVTCIAGGSTDRGVGHVVVWRNGMIHDPHPDRAGLKGDPEDYILLVPVNPKRGE